MAENWSRVARETRRAYIKKKYSGENEIIAVDLPSAASLNSYHTQDEATTKGYIHTEKPDVIINIVDTTNLSNSLFFTTQLLELGIPVVIALNKSEIDIEKLSLLLGCDIVETSATSEVGLETLIEKAVSIVGKPSEAPFKQGKVNYDKCKSIVAAGKKRSRFINKIIAQVEHGSSVNKVFFCNIFKIFR